MPVTHEFDPPERFVAGTVGEPGARTFFLQARSGPRLVSVALEKQQVAVLAERIDELLDEVMASAGNDTLIPAVAPVGLDDAGPLEQPIDEQFRAGTMTLSWDPAIARVVIEVFPLTEAADDAALGGEAEAGEESEPDEIFLVRLEAGPARAFVKRATLVLWQPDRPRRPPVRARQRVPPPRSVLRVLQ
jgi:uncharacterized repeat protein (TIGR03847 family)